MEGTLTALVITLSLLVSCISGHTIKRESGSYNGNKNNGTGNGNQNGNCFGICGDNESGNANGNVNTGNDNGNGNGNCEGNCVGNENGNANGNFNTNSSKNGNGNGNCVGNCFNNIEGNGNGNNNNNTSGQGNNQGNCQGNCFDRVAGNGFGNGKEGTSDEKDTEDTNCYGNCFDKQPMHKTSEYDANADVMKSPIQCKGSDHYMYYVAPGSFCLEIHKKFIPLGKMAQLEQISCPAGAVFDITLCRCNHWYLTKIRTDCKSNWFNWAWGPNDKN